MAPEAVPAPIRRSAPWRGRPRVADAKDKVFHLRWTREQFDAVEATAAEAGFKVAPYIRAVLLGSAGPRAMRRAPADKVELARLLAEIGKLGSNVNQIARYANTTKELPGHRELTLMQTDIAAMRAAVLGALGRGD